MTHNTKSPVACLPFPVPCYHFFVSTEFDPLTENAALKAAIVSAINDAGGALPFRDFMQLALYHPTLGYYT